MGVTITELLPAASRYGLSVEAGGNDSVVGLAHRRPDMFFYYANEDPTLPQARQVIEKYLKGGARGIGEQKFPIDCDSKVMQMVAEVAQEFNALVMMRFEDHDGSKLRLHMHLERFHKPLLRYPGAVFSVTGRPGGPIWMGITGRA